MLGRSILHFAHSDCETIQRCELINDLNIIVKSSFSHPTNVQTATNKVIGMLYFINRKFAYLATEIVVSLYKLSARPHLLSIVNRGIRYLERT